MKVYYYKKWFQNYNKLYFVYTKTHNFLSLAKVQEEIDRVVGGARQPSLSDKDNLPYTNAVIHEIQRIGNIIPINLARVVGESFQIGEYSLPKVSLKHPKSVGNIKDYK